MSGFALAGAFELGLLFSLIAFAVYISFRVLDFPDLTIDGSFPLGAAVTAILIVSGFNPWIATLISIVAGAMAGFVTAYLCVRMKILNLLASILVMIALYSINLRIMGGPNIALLGEVTIFDPMLEFIKSILYITGIPDYFALVFIFGAIIIIVFYLLKLFLYSESGLAMRAVGMNNKMANAQGINSNISILLGMSISNALVALAGSLYAQSQGIADVTMGVGTIVLGLASVIGGEALVNTRTVFRALVACVVGAVVYRLAITFALELDFLGFKSQDLNLLTAILVTLAIVLPNIKKGAAK